MPHSSRRPTKFEIKKGVPCGTLLVCDMELRCDESVIEINDGLKLIEKNDGLTFGTDAYLLSAYVRRQSRAVCADLGSGTGIIPLLLLARGKVRQADAIELQADFAELIGRNAELNGFSDKLRAVHSDVRDITADKLGKAVDIAVSNPPYMKPSGKPNESERKNIARHEIAGGIGEFCDAAYRILKHGGLFYTVWRPDRLSELLCALTAARLEPKRMTFVYARAELPPCLVLCEAKKGASAGMYVTPPLIMYSSGSIYTDELTKIYETGDFDEPYKRP